MRRASDGKVLVERKMRSKAVADGSARSEIILLRSLDHHGIITYVHGFIDVTLPVLSASLYMEQCNGSTLTSCIQRAIE